jgi:1,4-alpha-glucan branching enzyme
MSKMKGKKVKTKVRRTVFRLDSPEAKEVFLAGDFNNWDFQKYPMKREANGVWKRVTLLPPGKYEYKFFVDGRWENDPSSNQMCPNCFGSQNNVIEIKP